MGVATEAGRARRRAKSALWWVVGLSIWWALSALVPTEGWGVPVRVLMAGVLALGVLGLVWEAVVEFRRGWSGDDDEARAR